MPKVTFIEPSGDRRTIEAAPGQADARRDRAGVDGSMQNAAAPICADLSLPVIEAPGGLSEMEDAERDTLESPPTRCRRTAGSPARSR